VSAVRINSLEVTDESWAEILVQEKLHSPACGSKMALSPLTRGREGKSCTDVLRLETWEVGKDLLFGHAPGKVLEHVIDRDPRAFDARLTASDPGRYGDVVLEAHDGKATTRLRHTQGLPLTP